jgi:DNA polymerase III epsilon subunit-like protein
MLRTHGLDLANHTVLDTFELSEIFSQEAESLNLLFLAKHYQLPIAGEHRALDDTRLSVGLFLHYLDMIENMEQVLCNIWGHISIRDESGTIGTLMNLTRRV